MKDYYKILGLTEDASDEDIKKAYRKLASKWHPDKHSSESAKKTAEEEFKLIKEAYETLSDSNKRHSYDFSRKTSNTGSSSSFHHSHFEDVEDLMKNFFNQRSHGNPFSDIFGFSSASRIIAQAEVTLTFWEAIFGCRKTFELNINKSGTRQIKTVSVTLPAGCDNQDSFIVNVDEHQIQLVIHVQEDENFMRDNLDLYSHIDIPFTMAALGGVIKFPHWEGEIEISIPAGVQSGQKIRLPNKGIKKEMFVGDLYLQTNITVPKKLNKKQKELLEEFAKTEKEKENSWFDSLKKAWDKYTG